MRVGLDAHMLGHQETGNETYVLGLLHGLERIGFGVDAYVTHRPERRFHREHRVLPSASVARVPVSNPVLAVRDALDLWHGTYVLPPWLPCRSIVTVHDISYAFFPDWFSIQVRRMLDTFVPRALKSAAHVITISECSKRDITTRYDIDPDKVTVTYLAPRPGKVQDLDGETRGSFLLYVGNVSPRKNLDVVIEAMSRLRRAGVNTQLVVAGNAGSGDAQRLAAHLGLQDAIEFRGYVPDREAAKLYRTCAALVHPALYEGFGLTLVEAMAAGCPIIAADTSSIPEVVGDAGVLIALNTPEAWAQTLHDIVTDKPLRTSLSERGRIRARSFSWEKTARETAAVYQRVLQRPSGIF